MNTDKITEDVLLELSRAQRAAALALGVPLASIRGKDTSK
jgi:hypothetical protein